MSLWRMSSSGSTIAMRRRAHSLSCSPRQPRSPSPFALRCLSSPPTAASPYLRPLRSADPLCSLCCRSATHPHKRLPPHPGVVTPPALAKAAILSTSSSTVNRLVSLTTRSIARSVTTSLGWFRWPQRGVRTRTPRSSSSPWLMITRNTSTISIPSLVRWARGSMLLAQSLRRSPPFEFADTPPFPHMSRPVSPICQKFILSFRSWRRMRTVRGVRIKTSGFGIRSS